jgi:hypothetical protein
LQSVSSAARKAGPSVRRLSVILRHRHGVGAAGYRGRRC